MDKPCDMRQAATVNLWRAAARVGRSAQPGLPTREQRRPAAQGLRMRIQWTVGKARSAHGISCQPSSRTSSQAASTAASSRRHGEPLDLVDPGHAVDGQQSVQLAIRARAPAASRTHLGGLAHSRSPPGWSSSLPACGKCAGRSSHSAAPSRQGITRDERPRCLRRRARCQVLHDLLHRSLRRPARQARPRRRRSPRCRRTARASPASPPGST